MSIARGVLCAADGRIKWAWQWAFSNADPCPIDLPLEPGDRLWDCAYLADAFVAAWDDDGNLETPADALYLYSRAEREHHAFDDWQKRLHERTEADVLAILPAGSVPILLPDDVAGLYLQPGYRRLVRPAEGARPSLSIVDHDDGHRETVRSFPRHEVVHVLDGGDPCASGPALIARCRERRARKLAFDTAMAAAIDQCTQASEQPEEADGER